MDDFDHATEIEERHRALAIAAATRPIARPGSSAPISEVFCQNQACGVRIPEDRRTAAPGCRFCIECQERHEKALKQKGYAIHA